MGVTVNKPGICTTIQDLGRRGYLGSGFSPSGVMDKRAARIANLLVDNDENAPVLEFCLAGPTLRFTTNTCIALTGGNFSPTVDGAAIPMYAAIMVHRGSVLEFGAPKTGVYGYLAIAGGSIAVPKVKGSASTRLGRTRAVGGRLPALRHQERRFPGQSGLARAQRRQLLRFLVRRNRLARSAGAARKHVHRTGR